MIEVQNLTKRYGPLTAVDDVSFRVESGQILGFLGPNGAGKSTTMRILTGCSPPTDGRAFVAGFDVFDEPIEAKRRTGYLPETPPLYPDMSVREYLTFAARISGVTPSERAAKIDVAMARTSVADVAERHCGKLSRGYRQRVGLAQAILHNPDVLILDEPTAGLDPKQIIETRELIRDLAGDHTIILSTHILPEISQTCEQVVIIDKGRVIAVDTPENLTGRLGGSETVRLEVDAGGADPIPVLQAVDGITAVTGSEEHQGRPCHRGPKRERGRREARACQRRRDTRVGAARAPVPKNELGGHLPRAHHPRQHRVGRGSRTGTGAVT